MSNLGDRFRVAFAAHGENADAIFLASIYERELPFVYRASWPTSERDVDHVGRALLIESQDGRMSGLWERDDVLVRLSFGGSWLHAQAAATTESRAEETIAELRVLFPLPDPSASHEVPVTFWTYTPHGPMPSMRTIAVPEWTEIRENYAARTREQLEAVMHGFRPAHGGQLILWHGTAGTGKTFALRALAWEWREWCQVHYVVDPDTFFGQHADYLMNVLMQPEVPLAVHTGGWVSHSVVHMDEMEETTNGPQAWRLLVLEDTGELLTPDAKSVIGQGLSRFLNVVDGLIGQGLRVLVLVTTNEEIRALHPAVARPGRAAANIEFAPLSRDESAAWLQRHEIAEGPERESTLATLYAVLEGRSPTEPATSIGFGDPR
jgi:Domain of unknown function (DUF5925)/ATPase family associated with various cellular activities (AAA)